MSFDLNALYRRSNAESRSISAENPDGSRGGGGHATEVSTLHPPSARHGRDLGPGWKLSPCRTIEAGERVDIMTQAGPGIIRHIWFTLDPVHYRSVVVRIFWDGADTPSVECPVGDFFCAAWNTPVPVRAIPVNINPRGGLNAYWPMPFARHARIEIANDGDQPVSEFFYTVDFTLEPIPADALAFHAQFRRTPKLARGNVYSILDGIRGSGHFVGLFMAWMQRSDGWWGEGEVKMYLDGDTTHPTICGTGTEDYFGGAWCFGENYSAPYLGYSLIDGEEGKPGARMVMYRFHVPDPVFFKRDLRVTVQALGWKKGGGYLQLEDDLASTAFWYQTLPHATFPPLPDRDVRAA
jgi:hypothetical protein